MPSLSERARGWSHAEYVEYRRRDVLQMIQEAVNGMVALLLAIRKIKAALNELPELEKRVRKEDFLFLKGFPVNATISLWGKSVNTGSRFTPGKGPASNVLRTEGPRKVLSAFARIADDLRQPF